MKASLCLQTQHLPAKRHHKNVVIHSSVRLPPLQANNGSPPGAARVAVVGAGVVLACALGARYWMRARALQFPMHRSSPTSHFSESGDSPLSGELVSIQKLPDLLSEICIRTSDPMPPHLKELIDQCLTKEDKENVTKGQDLMRVLQNKLPLSLKGQHDYNLGLVVTLALINEKEYGKAEKICNELQGLASPLDSRPNILIAIINTMMIMESMVRSPSTTTTSELKKKLEIVQEAWETYKSKPEFSGAPPQIPE
ncbi:hypothetical protein LUZ62_048193 [Rhynchospora pubera]|uniref:Uncharacterized protein n=1 Tax=Rhynchospora pubera TaxID=906938 RepID=A0AAV8ATF0_9POAL|nr:hypothetical protein LUZ62_000170 [Rhynchospora pubera]KAJ4796947.1 hypothetical protein LUZ62_048193 [Rhynchospora pubera]